VDGITSIVTTVVAGELTPLSDFVTIDARLGYRVGDRITVALSAQGLFHDEQRQTSAAAVERRVFGSVAISF
jgi:hypothetical protein